MTVAGARTVPAETLYAISPLELRARTVAVAIDAVSRSGSNGGR